MALKKKDLVSMFDFMTLTLADSVKKQILKVSGRGNVSAARDYISAICLITEYTKATGKTDLSDITSANDLWNAIHPAVKFRLRSYTPCLAARYDALKPEQQNKLFEDPNWVCTEKQNGCRGWLINYKGDIFLFSRNYSDVDCGLLDYWKNINQTIAPTDEIYAIDVEIKFEPGVDIRDDLEHLGLETDSTLEAMVALLHTHAEDAIAIQEKFKNLYHKDLIVFRLIAPLYFNGMNYLGRTLGEGMDVYNECIEFGRSLGLNVLPIDRCSGSREEKEIFLNTIIDNGGEGVVFHNKKGFYCTSENRSKESFIKLKRSISATQSKQGLGDQIDGFVTGFKMGSNGTANEGLISALAFSIIIDNNGKRREHVIAIVPNIDLETKKMCTLNDASGMYPQEWTDSNGETHWVSLNPEFDHLVGEIDGQALSSKSQRMEHPRLIMWRTERDPESCIYTQAWLDANTTASVYTAGKISY